MWYETLMLILQESFNYLESTFIFLNQLYKKKQDILLCKEKWKRNDYMDVM